MNDSFVETSIAPWLAVNDGAKAVAYYKEALGAADVYRLDGNNGSVAVAQLKIGQALFWVQDDIASSPAAEVITQDDRAPYGAGRHHRSGAGCLGNHLPDKQPDPGNGHTKPVPTAMHHNAVESRPWLMDRRSR